MTADYDCSSEFQPCTSTYLIVCCLKIANTHTHLQIQRGSHLIQILSSSILGEKKKKLNISPWQFSVSAFLSWRGNLWGCLGLVSWTYLWDVFVIAKASSEKCALLWEQRVGGCVEVHHACVIMPLSLRWVFKVSSTQTHRFSWWLISVDY